MKKHPFEIPIVKFIPIMFRVVPVVGRHSSQSLPFYDNRIFKDFCYLYFSLLHSDSSKTSRNIEKSDLRSCSLLWKFFPFCFTFHFPRRTTTQKKNFHFQSNLSNILEGKLCKASKDALLKSFVISLKNIHIL